MNKINYLSTFFMLASCAAAVPALAQGATNYPVRPVRFITPFPPGGRTELLARLVALMPHLKSNRLKLPGVARMKQQAILPEAPTLHESGAPGYDANP